MALFPFFLSIIFLMNMGLVKCITINLLLLIFLPLNAQKAEKVITSEFDNLYRISDALYRSEQPSRAGFEKLDSINIANVLSLRNRVGDNFRARKSNVQLRRVKINSWRMSYENIVASLEIIRDADKPILVHCLHGSDRTGAVVAAYRMAFEGWSKEDAITEFLDKKYGYHEKWFPDILELLKNIDVVMLREDLKI